MYAATFQNLDLNKETTVYLDTRFVQSVPAATAYATDLLLDHGTFAHVSTMELTLEDFYRSKGWGIKANQISEAENDTENEMDTTNGE